MANRAKEDEKNEKIIRGLLKLPANRRCINCNNLGPQYVCTNFWTFICTNCSGMHREFTHRVKSISMAKFASHEVSALQEGGNERAKEIYFKDWDPHRYSFPDSSNMDKLRDFIKHVYVDCRFAGGRQGDRSQGLKGDRDDFDENRKAESYRGASRSPPYEGRYSPNYGSRNDVKYVYGERSPGFDQSRHKRSPVRFEVVDDRVRDDKFRNTSQNRRLPDAPKPEGGRSPDHQKGFNNLSPPMVRPVRDILGDDVPQLQISGGGTTKSNGVKVPDESAQMKTTLSSSSISSTDGNTEQLKVSHTESLIDFDADPGPPVSAKSEQSVPQPTANVTDNGVDWAAFDITGQKITQMASNTNPLVAALAELSILESSPAGKMQTGFESYPKATGGGNLPTVQQQQRLVSPPPDDNPSSNQPPNAPVLGASNNQTWMPSPVPYGQGSFTGSTVYPEGHLPPAITKPNQVTTTGVSSPLPSEESKRSGRKELPVDFFTSLYPSALVSAPAPAPGWQTGLYPGLGYNMHPIGMAMPQSLQAPKSVNPFDLTGDPAPMFLQVPAPQTALQNMTAPGTLLRTSSFEAPSQRLVSSQQSPYMPNVSPSPFMTPNDMHQQSAAAMMSLQNPGFAGPAYGSMSIDPHPSVRFPQSGTSNSFGSVEGNPFG